MEMKMGLTARETYLLFPTGFFTGKLPDLTLCDRVEKKLKEMQKAGQGVTANSYLRSFMTDDDIQTLPEMKELSDVIMEESKLILDVYKVKRDSHYIVNMWANITSPNRRHNTHTHANCLFSGLVYIRTPKNCGSTMFFSPRHLETSISPDFTDKNELNSQIFSFPAEKGRMVFWPSYLPHAVDNGNANEDEDRIVVAFNIMIRGRIDAPTISLTLN
jgi:uncharacterized protein (TIGR02466 family)